jgi:DNA-binding MarR family transcriptional regulator
MTAADADEQAHAGYGLGTRLRYLLELLDGDVESIYREAGLSGYRPRYTPVMRTLDEVGAATIKTIAERAGASHSAISQTVAQMTRAGLVRTRPGADARERMVSLTPAGRRLLPRLAGLWANTAAAAKALDAELPHTLSAAIEQAIAALEGKPFRERVRAARSRA